MHAYKEIIPEMLCILNVYTITKSIMNMKETSYKSRQNYFHPVLHYKVKSIIN
jgi:hypothetical protein